MALSNEEKDQLIFYLRLPVNINVAKMRQSRYKAADELERLYLIEKNFLLIKEELKDLKEKLAVQ